MLPQKRVNADKTHPLYWIWNSMYVRCYYPSHQQYKDYGGRGIEVCFAWLDFSQFVADVEYKIGRRPSKKYTLDRIDNDGNYDVWNIRWATRRQQNRGRRVRETDKSI